MNRPDNCVIAAIDQTPPRRLWLTDMKNLRRPVSNRRQALGTLSRMAALSAVAGGSGSSRCLIEDLSAAEPSNDGVEVGPLETFVPTRQITFGPKQHWFGYYDKREFSSDGKRILACEVDFEHRSPTADDSIGVGMVDTADGDRWQRFGTTKAWGWQQACMLQWVGQNDDRVMWNDRTDGQFVARIRSMDSGDVRTLDRPIYTLAPSGEFGLSVDFARLDHLRPGYGYDGGTDRFLRQRAPEGSGVWRVDMQSGDSQLILSLADVVRLPWPDGKTHEDAWHYFNHLLINPAGNRFIVLHRYRPKFDPDTMTFEGQFVTRMLTASIDGGDVRVVDPSGHTSHFIWKDDQTITAWTRPAGSPWGFYDLVDAADPPPPERIGASAMRSNGHNTYLPAPHQDWILNDTYPSKKDRRQTVYLYHVPSGRRVDLGHFPSPPAYTGEWRCDTHPRSGPNGRQVAIDSPHADGGRQIYLLDIASIVSG